MRILELILLILLMPALVELWLSPGRWRWLVRSAASAAVVVMIVHWLVEGWRWQMMPAYALVTGCFIRALVIKTPARHQRTIAVTASVMYLLAWLLPVALPVFELPTPSGPYAIGTTAREWPDGNRLEPFSGEGDQPRRLMARFWYPIDADQLADDARRSPYLEGGPWFLSHWRLVETSSWVDASMAETDGEGWPVILWNHCYTCPLFESTMLMQELASHGFVVVSVAHPYEEIATVYPNGDVVKGDDQRMKAVRQQFPLNDFYDAMAAADDSQQEALFRNEANSADLILESLRVWTDDSHAILDRLPSLGDRVDTGRIGVGGYSLGGTTAAQLCVERPEVRACLDIDCLAYGSMIDSIPPKPLMFLSSQAFSSANDAIFKRTVAPAYHATIAGTTHQNFSDMHLQAPFIGWLSVPRWMASRVGMYGPVLGDLDPDRASVIANAYVLAFFQRHLQNDRAPLLDGPSANYPEVSIKVRNVGPVAGRSQAGGPR